MTRNTETLNSIRELNMSYLLLAQRLIASDRDAAQVRLGLTADMADTLAALSPAQTVKLASGSQVLCFFRMDSGALLAGLAERAARAPASLASAARESLATA